MSQLFLDRFGPSYCSNRDCLPKKGGLSKASLRTVKQNRRRLPDEIAQASSRTSAVGSILGLLVKLEFGHGTKSLKSNHNSSRRDHRGRVHFCLNCTLLHRSTSRPTQRIWSHIFSDKISSWKAYFCARYCWRVIYPATLDIPFFYYFLDSINNKDSFTL